MCDDGYSWGNMAKIKSEQVQIVAEVYGVIGSKFEDNIMQSYTQITVFINGGKPIDGKSKIVGISKFKTPCSVGGLAKVLRKLSERIIKENK